MERTKDIESKENTYLSNLKSQTNYCLGSSGNIYLLLTRWEEGNYDKDLMKDLGCSGPFFDWYLKTELFTLFQLEFKLLLKSRIIQNLPGANVKRSSIGLKTIKSKSRNSMFPSSGNSLLKNQSLYHQPSKGRSGRGF